MFLITGAPRSGTLYTAKVFQALGYPVTHERRGQPDGEIGTVSWMHLREARKFRPVIHQTRHPVDTIASMLTIRESSWRAISRQVGQLPHEPIRRAMYAWLEWTDLARRASTWQYQVERLGEFYPILFQLLNLPIPDSLPSVSKTTNHREHQVLTWNDLAEADYYLYARICGRALEYGYA